MVVCPWFYSMIDRDVPPTNNAAERALWPSIIFRKVTNAFRSIWGADVHALVQSLGRLNGFSRLSGIARSLTGQQILAA